MGLGEDSDGALGWLGQLWLLRAWLTHPGWEAWWDGGPCSSGGSCGVPGVRQPESLQAPLPTGSKASRLSGPVLASWWSDLQQHPDHLSRALVSHQVNQTFEAVLGWGRGDVFQVLPAPAGSSPHPPGVASRQQSPQCPPQGPAPLTGSPSPHLSQGLEWILPLPHQHGWRQPCPRDYSSQHALGTNMATQQPLPWAYSSQHALGTNMATQQLPAPGWASGLQLPACPGNQHGHPAAPAPGQAPGLQLPACSGVVLPAAWPWEAGRRRRRRGKKRGEKEEEEEGEGRDGQRGLGQGGGQAGMADAQTDRESGGSRAGAGGRANPGQEAAQGRMGRGRGCRERNGDRDRGRGREGEGREEDRGTDRHGQGEGPGRGAEQQKRPRESRGTERRDREQGRGTEKKEQLRNREQQV